MPNLPTHIALARRAAERLQYPVIHNNPGAYLLGATAPDIRIITKRQRHEYHFAYLDFDKVGAGMSALFEAHPKLRKLDGHDATRAFVAGYLTHLMAYEVWITTMFRPHFANPDLFPDHDHGLVMDRACQIKLDRENRADVDPFLDILARPVHSIEVGFIPTDTLGEWQKWVVEFIRDRAYSWDRLRNQAKRIARGDEPHPAHDHTEAFINDLPDSIAKLHERVPQGLLVDYQVDALDILTGTLKDYLG